MGIVTIPTVPGAGATPRERDSDLMADSSMEPPPPPPDQQQQQQQHQYEEQDQPRGPYYGDIRICSDRRNGTCLFWVVPDVAPGFNVPGFYDDFIVERREHVRARLEYEAQRRAMQAVPSVDLSDR